MPKGIIKKGGWGVVSRFLFCYFSGFCLTTAMVMGVTLLKPQAYLHCLREIGVIAMVVFLVCALQLVVCCTNHDLLHDVLMHLPLASTAGAVVQTLADAEHETHDCGWLWGVFKLVYLCAGEAHKVCSGGVVSIFSTFLERVHAKNIIKRG